MEKREFKKLGVSSSLLGYGCMRFPVNADGTINEEISQKLLDHAIENGVTYIDTAYPYHQEKSELFVGKALEKYPRDSYFLATKLPIWEIEKTEDVRKIFEEQLGKLRTNHVDFYLMHALDKERWDKIKDLKILEEVERLRSEGKIRFIGFSFHDELPIFEEIIKGYNWDFCQIQLNYIDRFIQQGMRGYEIAEELEIPLIIMEPVKGGQLAKLPEELEKEFKTYNSEYSTASWSFRWLGSLPNVKVILSGMTEMNQLEDNLKTFSNFKSLNNEEMERVEKVTKMYRDRQMNNCTTCGYCMPCPFGVNIPGNFKIWNKAHVYEDIETAKKDYEKLEDGRAEMCKACGACEPQCPQKITIIEDLKKVAAELSR